MSQDNRPVALIRERSPEHRGVNEFAQAVLTCIPRDVEGEIDVIAALLGLEVVRRTLVVTVERAGLLDPELQRVFDERLAEQMALIIPPPGECS